MLSNPKKTYIYIFKVKSEKIDWDAFKFFSKHQVNLKQMLPFILFQQIFLISGRMGEIIYYVAWFS